MNPAIDRRITFQTITLRIPAQESAGPGGRESKQIRVETNRRRLASVCLDGNALVSRGAAFIPDGPGNKRAVLHVVQARSGDGQNARQERQRDEHGTVHSLEGRLSSRPVWV